MARCSICQGGELEEQLIEEWMQRNARWALFRKVPAQVCDLCGERSLSQGVAERLATLVDPRNKQAPTDSLWSPVYDLAVIDQQQAQGKRPLQVLSSAMSRQEGPLTTELKGSVAENASNEPLTIYEPQFSDATR